MHPGWVWYPRHKYLPSMTHFDHFEKLLMILALIWRKKMDAMKESERTRTMNGSLCNADNHKLKGDHVYSGRWGRGYKRIRTLGVLVNRPCTT